MLRITIDLCPYGDEDKARTIGQMLIGNIGSAGSNAADYVVLLEGQEVAQVKGHQREDGPWELARKAIGKLTPGQKKGRPSPFSFAEMFKGETTILDEEDKSDG